MKFAIGFWLALAAFSHAAGLEFSSLLEEVNAPVDASTVTADFNFTNKGDKPVTIAKSDPGCSCLKVQVAGGKMKYAPGESGVLRTTFDMGNFTGTVDKSIALWIDNDPEDKPSQKLTVRVHIPVLIDLEPKTVKWDVGGNAGPQTIQIRMAEGKTIHVLGVTSSSPAFTSELKTLEDGKKYDLVITPADINAAALGIIRIQTDCEIARHKTLQVFAISRKATAGETAAKP